jgi:hypothetical protein
MIKKIKRLPLGISTFSEMIQKEYIYVDKTQSIYHMITNGKYYFLSRPRRFGKSLLVSTLSELFSGNKELFNELWIAQSDYSWSKHPIIKIDFSGIDYSTCARLEKSLLAYLYALAKHYAIKLIKTDSAKDLLNDLIDKLSTINSVVLLVDEYDKPIIDNLYDVQKAEEQRIFLQNFYATIKARDAQLHFVLLTGVSRFSKTSIFSGLNNLLDISMDQRYATILGYDQHELVHHFKQHIQQLSTTLNKNFNDTVQEITDHYDGYRFTSHEESVFNPYSVLVCLDAKKLGNFWFSTGTPTFLINLLQNNDYDLESITQPILNQESLSSFEPSNIPLPALLFQTGYLTIHDYDQKTNNYTLGIPNKEVNNGLTIQLTNTFTQLPANKSIQYARAIAHTFVQGNMNELAHVLQDFFNRMPYTVHIKNEHSLQFVLYAIFALIGVTVDPEVTTSLGRADLVVSLHKRVYIIELKFNRSAREALDQINHKRYYEKYDTVGKEITLLGINFDHITKTISLEWQAP